MLDDGPGIRPGTKEELDETMIEDVEKTRECVISRQHIVVGLFGRGKRQSTLRPEQTEIFDEYLDGLIVALLDARQVGRWKIHERVLPKLDDFFAPGCAVSNARAIPVLALKMPQHGE